MFLAAIMISVVSLGQHFINRCGTGIHRLLRIMVGLEALQETLSRFVVVIVVLSFFLPFFLDLFWCCRENWRHSGTGYTHADSKSKVLQTGRYSTRASPKFRSTHSACSLDNRTRTT